MTGTGPGRGALRVLRGGLLAGACAALAVGGHALGGGAAAPGPAVVVSLLLAAWTVLWADRQRGRAALAAFCGGTQVAYHLAFSLSADAAVHARHGHGHGHGGAHEAMTSATDAHMLLAHVLAAAVTGVLLGHGEAALWAVARRLRRALPQLVLVVAAPAAPHRVPVPAGPAVRGAGLRLAAASERRGPPSVATA